MAERLTIGVMSRRTGVKVETIRYYERVGLLSEPNRTETGNYRDYSPEALFRLSFIRRARDLGFSLDKVRALLDLADERDRDCCDVDVIAQRHLKDIEQKISDLTALGDRLRDLIGSCQRGVVADCRIIEALSPHL